MDSNTGLRLLSLDGGGIRGLSELVVLRAIMMRVKDLLHLDEMPRPAQYFDMIGGTSTGGLIAIMLGRLQMTVDEAMTEYGNLSQRIFGSKRSRFRDGKFSADGFEKVIKAVVLKRLGDENAKMSASQDSTCKVFVCTVAARSVPRPRLFRSYRRPGVSEYDCAIWEAARATCAAPTYFERVMIGPEGRQEEFLDAGVGCNNPIEELHLEAEAAFDSETPVSCIVSLGTGVRNPIDMKRDKLFPVNVINAFKKMALSSEQQELSMDKKYKDIEDLYYRLNVERGLQGIKLSDWEDLALVQTRTYDYLQSHGVGQKIEAIALALIGKTKRYDSTHYTLGHLSMSTKNVINAVRGASEKGSLYGSYQASNFTIDESPETILHSWLKQGNHGAQSAHDDHALNLAKRHCNEENGHKSGQWLFETPEWDSFDRLESQTLLWLQGPPGSGKSVLSAVIVDKLQESRQKNDSVVLYHYCHCEHQSTTSLDIVRSLLMQCLRIMSQEMMDSLYHISNKKPELDNAGQAVENGLWSALTKTIQQKDRKVYIVLDGVDELKSNASPLGRFLSLMRSTQGKIPISLLLSSRFDFDVAGAIEEMDGVAYSQINVNGDVLHQDLMEYVTFRVNNKRSPLRSKPQQTRVFIAERVCQQAQSSFLYASLVLDELKGRKISSLAEIKKTLEDLPSELSEAYKSHLEIPKNSPKGTEVFQWLCCAKRSLSWNEVTSALSIVDGTVSKDDFVDDPCEVFVQHNCGYLVEVFGDGRDKIRLIHPTVKDLLLAKGGPGEDLEINQAHSFIALKLLLFLQNQEPPSFYPTLSLSENRDEVAKYVQKPGFEIYSYAVLNWFYHVARCEDGFQEEVDEQLCSFLSSESCISWLKSALFISMLTGNTGDSTALTADVVECLEVWIRARPSEYELETTAFVRSWVNDFLDLMQDWGRALEHSPFWVHFIPQQFLDSENSFQEALELTADQAVIQMTDDTIRTARNNPAPWQHRCFSIDRSRNLAYTWNRTTAQLSCYHMNTGLLAAQMKLIAGPEDLSSYELVLGTQCPQNRFMAILFRETHNPPHNNQSFVYMRSGLQLTSKVHSDELSWVLQNETCIDEYHFLPLMEGISNCRSLVCILELSHDGNMRTDLFGYPKWPIQPAYRTHNQWVRWETDDVNILAFSPDSSLLVTPTCLIALDTGVEVNQLLLCNDWNITSASVTNDFGTLVTVREWKTLEFSQLSNPTDMSVKHSRLFSGIIHVLATSHGGRFTLILQLENYVQSEVKGSKPRDKFPQHGRIGIYDRKKGLWTPLIETKPPQSKRLSSWDFRHHHLCTKFGPESQNVLKANKVVLQSPPGWQPHECVRVGDDCSPLRMLSDKCVIAFESQSVADGFGSHPNLVFVERAMDFQVTVPGILYADLVLGLWNPIKYRQSFLTAEKFNVDPAEHQTLSARFPYNNRDKLKGVVLAPSPQERVDLVLLSDPQGDACRIRMQIVRDPEIAGERSNGADSQLDIASSAFYDVELNYGRSTRGHTDALRPNTRLRVTNNALPLHLQDLTLREDQLTVGVSLTHIDPKQTNAHLSECDPTQDLLSELIENFRRSCRPLADIPPSAADLVGNSPFYTIFSQQSIRVAGIQPSPGNVVIHDDKGTRGFVLSNVAAIDNARHFIQFSRALNCPQDFSKLQEAVQHEVYLCIYDSESRRVSWCIHTTSGGDIQRSPDYIPTVAWALHPKQPLLLWTLPGHALRVSHLESSLPPVNVGDCLMIDNEASEAVKFSPNGRFACLRVFSTIKNDILVDDGPKQKDMALVVLDFESGTNTLLRVPPKLTLSHDLTDNCLRLYQLAPSGAVQMDSFFLPDLIAFDRHILTFIPDQCCCTTCKLPLSNFGHITVKEVKGVKTITLCHSPIPFGRTRVAGQSCDPLILNVASPELPVELSGIEGSLVLSRKTRKFPSLITSSGDLQMPASVVQKTFSLLPAARPKSVQTEGSDGPPSIRQMQPRKSSDSSSGAQDGKVIDHKYDWRADYERSVRELEFSEAMLNEIRNSSIMGDLHEEYGDLFPASWDEMLEMASEMANSDDSEFNDWIDALFGSAGIGCSIPAFIHTFHFNSCEIQGDANTFPFTWSCALDVGWVEEPTELFMRRAWDNKLAGTRTWYDFEPFSDAPVGQSMTQALADLKQQRKEGRKEDKKESEEKPLNFMTLFAAALEKEMDLQDPEVQEAGKVMTQGAAKLSSLTRFLDDMEEVMPGIGKIFKSRIAQFTSQSFTRGIYQEIEE